jgi:hypothetical protein
VTNDTTKDLPPSSEPPSHEQIGFDIDVTHEETAVFIAFRIRVPRGGALKRLVDALTSEDRGFNRLGGPDAST